MDNLTHTLLGVMLSRAGLNRLTPRATLTMVLAANAPDIDVIAWAWGPLTYLRHHRGLTHAAISVPVLAAIVAGLAALVSRRKEGKPQWRRIYLATLIGVASHPLLDLTNTYGVRPWLPFSAKWYSWDVFPIVDLWIWVMLGLFLVGPALGRLISAEIGDRPGSGRGAAIFALVLLMLWWGARGLFHARAMALLDAHTYGFESDRSPPLRVAAFPNMTNPLVWRGLVETEGFYQIIPLNVLGPLDPTRGQVFFKPERGPVVETALRTPTASAFAQFARYRFTTVDRREDGYRVVFTDFRFAGERRNAFVCSIVLDDGLRVVRERFSF